MSRYSIGGTPCPQDSTHGALYVWNGTQAAWYCPNARHQGTPFYFTNLEPVEAQVVAPNIRKIASRPPT